MIKDYKGEMPKNVTTPEKGKAKKPFYKDWKFWVLTGLMTLFGACSIYGLVLGSQYVKAIERASHIIADANGSGGEEAFSKPNTKNLPSNRVVTFDLTCDYSVSNSVAVYYDINGGYTLEPTYGGIYWRVYTNVFALTYRASKDYDLAAYDYVQNLTFNFTPTQGSWVNFYPLFTPSESTPLKISGTFYPQGYNQGYSNGYADGYSEGHSEGYEEGYEEGYSDGSDAINLNQSVKVLLPAGAENSCSFTTYLDGVPDQQGILSSSSSFGAYGEFARDRTQKLRIDLTLPSGYRAFFMYVPHWTSAYPSDENYSLRQSWAVSGVTYLPTWVSKPEIYVGITSALVDDLTYGTISVAFDVDHWGDVKVGPYQEGYQQGYVDGQENPTAYQTGYDSGYADGQAQGETDGFNRGVAVGSSGSQSLMMMFKTAFQLPFDQLYRFLNFNLLGINFLSLFTALISVSIGIMVIKKVL